MQSEGLLVKMPSRLGSDHRSVEYVLRLEEPRPGAGKPPAEFREIELNRLVGRAVRIEHTGELNCLRCGRSVDKLFGEGFCYPCFRDAPEASECIVKPELCEAHLGRGRDPEWEEAHHNQPHAVYLAVSSAVKVGVTRLTQIPTRWIDQGAAWAVQIAQVPYRQLAGRIEVALKELYTDRTAWQRMLKGQIAEDVDIAAEVERLRDHISGLPDGAELLPYLISPTALFVQELHYPLAEVPVKVKSVNLLKNPVVESTLLGIRGQYMLFEGGVVMNVRRQSGFRVMLEV